VLTCKSLIGVLTHLNSEICCKLVSIWENILIKAFEVPMELSHTENLSNLTNFLSFENTEV